MVLSTAKVDDHTIQAVLKVESVTAKFTLTELRARRAEIQAQKDRENALRDEQLADIDAIIASCATLGIVEKTE